MIVLPFPSLISEGRIETEQNWNGLPHDEPGIVARERRMHETQDAHDTARLLGVPLLDVMDWEGRLTVTEINEPTKGE